jgi:hypothetical protein
MNRLVQLFSKDDADNRAVEYGVIAAALRSRSWPCSLSLAAR